MIAPKTRPDPHVGARVRVLGVGTGTIIGETAMLRHWTIELDEPSRYPADHGRRFITRNPGEFHVIPADQEGTRA